MELLRRPKPSFCAKPIKNTYEILEWVTRLTYCVIAISY